MIKRLQDRGVLKNEDTIVTSLVTKEDAQQYEIEEMMEKRFEGSLPAFIAAFCRTQSLSQEEIDEIHRIIGR